MPSLCCCENKVGSYVMYKNLLCSYGWIADNILRRGLQTFDEKQLLRKFIGADKHKPIYMFIYIGVRNLLP